MIIITKHFSYIVVFPFILFIYLFISLLGHIRESITFQPSKSVHASYYPTSQVPIYKVHQEMPTFDQIVRITCHPSILEVHLLLLLLDYKAIGGFLKLKSSKCIQPHSISIYVWGTHASTVVDPHLDLSIITVSRH